MNVEQKRNQYQNQKNEVSGEFQNLIDLCNSYEFKDLGDVLTEVKECFDSEGCNIDSILIKICT